MNENIEIQSKPKSRWKKILISITVGLAAVLSFTIWLVLNQIDEIKEKESVIKSYASKYNKSENAYHKAANTRDSALYIIHEFRNYRDLMEAMKYRDSVTAPLIHEVGDIVYLKPDSTIAVITDVHVGGGKYDFYVKYVIRRKDDTMETIIPELLY